MILFDDYAAFLLFCIARCGHGLGRLWQTRVLAVVVVAGITERFTAALGATVSADQHAAIAAHRHYEFATAKRLAPYAVFDSIWQVWSMVPGFPNGVPRETARRAPVLRSLLKFLPLTRA